MTKLLASTCLGLGLMLSFGCQAVTPDEDEDLPATPIEIDDAPRALAEQICSSLFSCECPASAGFADEAACIEQQTAQIQLDLDSLLDGDRTWNAECAGELAKTWSKWACYGPDTAPRESSYSSRVCPIIKGNLGPGADCWNTTLGDDCREGLSCIDGSCIESPILPVPIGSTCEYQWETLPCEAGSYCKWSDSGPPTCVAAPQEGDACNPDFDYVCGLSSHDMICDWDSASCLPAPGEGEPCFNQFLCGPGTYCDGGKDFTCQPRKQVGDGCGADAVCPVDASCINNICTADAAAVCNLQNWP